MICVDTLGVFLPLLHKLINSIVIQVVRNHVMCASFTRALNSELYESVVQQMFDAGVEGSLRR